MYSARNFTSLTFLRQLNAKEEQQIEIKVRFGGYHHIAAEHTVALQEAIELDSEVHQDVQIVPEYTIGCGV